MALRLDSPAPDTDVPLGDARRPLHQFLGAIRRQLLEQCWNWKLNVDAGLNLFAQKRGAALAYLGQGGRSYSEDQLNHEAVSRWNGGAYHEWDANAGEWVRKANVLCDSQTGNIGWDMNDPSNTGRSEADLHERDRGGYSAGPAANSHWKYFGVCYADRMLGDYVCIVLGAGHTP